METGAAATSDESQQAGAVADDRDADADKAWLAIVDLYRREQPGLVRLARVLVDDRGVAEELVQEAFLRLHPHIGRTERPGAYLRTTLVNLCRADHRRARTAARHTSSGARVASAPDIPADLSATWIALGGLPTRQREALILRFYLDMPDEEIAGLLGARPGTVRSLISRGLTRLKEVLEQ